MLAFALLLIAKSAGATEIKPFAREDMASDAVRVTETLRIATAAIGAQVKGKTPDQLRAKGGRRDRRASNFDAPPKSLRARRSRPLSKTLPIGSLTRRSRSKPTMRKRTTATNSLPAARPWPTPPICARRRRKRKPQRSPCSADLVPGPADELLGAATALDALKASLDRRDLIDVRKTYQAMRAEHGFRILDYKVDNESASPRVCFNFSEQLAREDGFFPLHVAGVRVLGHRDLE